MTNTALRIASAAIGLPILLAAVWLGGVVFLILIAVVALAVSWELARMRIELGISVLAGAGIVIALALSSFLAIRAEGPTWLLLTLLTTFATDTAAYATGRGLGRHRMAPAISPSKTWEGAAGGLLAAAVVCPLLAMILGLPEGPWAVLGFGIGIAAQVGDLAESALKRRAGVKDSSGLIPGHGGVLDRLDSLVLVAPLVYHYSQWLT